MKIINYDSAGCLKAGAALLALLLFGHPVAAVLAQTPTNAPRAVSALGRLEPEQGIIRIGAPSTPEAISGAVLAALHVKEGEDVSAGQLLATLDTLPVMQAFEREAQAELEFAVREAEATRSRAEEACVRADVSDREAVRRVRLHEQGVAGEEEADSARGEAEARAASCTAAQSAVRSSESSIEVSRARLDRVRAELERAYIRAPMDGRVLAVLVHPGELILAEGILEMGRVAHMVAIAEVYETDIRFVREGQRAVVSSAVLDEDLEGRVNLIRNKVEKQDETGTDPAARKDARVVEVEILLDDPGPAARLSNLQVDVVIHP
jgi:HlyD family secretion protein